MHVYDTLARTPEEIVLALAQEGAVLVLDPRQFEVVPTASGIMLQTKSIDFELPIAIPNTAFRVMLPHREHFPSPPEGAVRFAIGDHIHVGGTSS